MPRDPFRITGPAVVSFSGGRTSGYMLWRILQAHGGALPEGVVVVFCNTGKEREETLRFVERCAVEWGVSVVWLEYRHLGPRKPSFAVVDFATASRDGEPFVTAVTARSGDSGYLPNVITRYCTIELKIKTTIRYLLSLGWEEWTNAIGFRADEPQRVAKARAKASQPLPDVWELADTLFGKSEVAVRVAVAALREPREEAAFPLHAAGVTRAGVMDFWASHPFDLELGADEGNCDLCFLKGQAKLERLMRQWPEAADWWIALESRRGTRFRNDRPGYAALLELSKRPQLPGMTDEPDELSVACHCTD